MSTEPLSGGVPDAHVGDETTCRCGHSNEQHYASEPRACKKRCRCISFESPLPGQCEHGQSRPHEYTMLGRLPKLHCPGPADPVVSPVQGEAAPKGWMSVEECASVKTEAPRDTYRCNRKACDHFAQVKGGYCPCCFQRRMTEPYPRPEVVVLCGSTRFYDEFRRQNLRLTLEGKIVLSIGCDTKSDDDLARIDGQPIEAVKADLDALHKRKIDLADRVLVLNVGGYIGESTRSEIEYAEWWEKPIDYLEAFNV